MKNFKVGMLIGIVIFLSFFSIDVQSATLQEVFIKKRVSLIKTFVKAGFEVEPLFNDSRLKLYPEIIRPPKALPDEESYYQKVLKYESVQRGRKVLIDYAELLQEVEDKFRVNKEHVVAIYRVETYFGSYLGKYEVFNSLLTWVIGGKPSRAKWAENELKSYLKICSIYNLDPFSVSGSTHGAFGLLQFIPSSFLIFAVDGNGDGAIDLFNPADAFHSTGNYLSKFGWDMRDEKKQRSALWRYNHDRIYVDVVAKYAKAIKVLSLQNM
jgi:membrane-bound lytic murein transglycosylase B